MGDQGTSSIKLLSFVISSHLVQNFVNLSGSFCLDPGPSCGPTKVPSELFQRFCLLFNSFTVNSQLHSNFSFLYSTHDLTANLHHWGSAGVTVLTCFKFLFTSHSWHHLVNFFGQNGWAINWAWRAGNKVSSKETSRWR